MKSAAAIRAQVEAALGPGFPSPFAFHEAYRPATVSCGIPEIDSLTGGLPRGGLTEITGLPSSGRTSLMFSIIGAMTARPEVCALVDAWDALDPASALAAGVVLDRLLWVRCRSLEQALRATDLLLAGGGFGAVVVDLGDVPNEMARRVPLSSWFRLRRLVEPTLTVLLLLEQESCAKSCASLVLRLGVDQVCWSKLETGNWKLETRFVTPNVSHGCLLRGSRLSAEVIRDRSSRAVISDSNRVEFRVSNL